MGHWRLGRRAGAVVVAALLVTGSGCGDGGSSSSEAESAPDGTEPVDSSQLSAAAEASLASESYVMTVSSSEEAPGGFELTYEAPDRVLLRSGDGTDLTETYVVGEDMFLSDFAQPGRFSRVDTPENYVTSNAQFALRLILDAEIVEVDGDTYEFRLGEEDGAGRAVIRDGLVSEVSLPLTLDGRETEVRYTFDQYGSAPAVEAPDSSLVDEGPAAPECDEDGPDETTPLCVDPS